MLLLAQQGLHRPALLRHHSRRKSLLCRPTPVRGRAFTAEAQGTRRSSTPGPPLTPEQQAATEQLAERMSTSSVGQADAETQAWFLRDRRYDVDEAEMKLRKMLTWRRQVLRPPVPLEDISAEAATGKGFVHRHLDRQRRPVVVIIARKHRLGEFSLEHSQRFCGFLLDRALEQLPEGEEKLLGVFDMRDFGPLNTDLAFARFLVDAFFLYYPSRLGEVLLVDAPWGFQPVWGIVKPLLRSYGSLVRFVSREELRREYFTPETLPEAFRR